MKKKTVPLPCTEEEYKLIKMYCLVNEIKYVDLTKKLIELIKRDGE